MSEETDRFALVASRFDARVQAVPPEQWGAQSPCEEWNARDVVGHIVGNYRSMAAQATGGEASGMGQDEDPRKAWTEAYDRMRSLVNDPEMLAKTVNGPTGPTTLEQLLGGVMAFDTHIHTWDLARSQGIEEHLDPDVVRLTQQTLGPLDEMIRRPGVFGPKVEPPQGADEQTQLLCFLGRRV